MRFNSNFAALALAASAAVATFGAQATSIDVKVTGTITPGACTPTLAGGGTVDYGLIDGSELNKTAFNVLSEKTITFALNCNVPMRAAIRATDNRSSSLVTGATAAIATGLNDTYNYGLGTVATANVGGFAILMKPNTFTADTVSVFTVLSSNTGTTWAANTAGALPHGATDRVSWSTTATGVPVAFRALSGSLTIQAVLNQTDALPLSSDVAIDGSATLEVVYL